MKIGFCTGDHVVKVMEFLSQHWAPNHILSRHRQLLDWQHLDRESKRYNIVIAEDNDGSIVGILGFIPTSQFDRRLRAQDTLWLTSWKVRENNAPPGLGLQLHSFLERHVAHVMIGTVGNNEHAGRIYKALGYATGTMQQYYLLNRRKASFKLCTAVPPSSTALSESPDSIELQRLDLQRLGEVPWHQSNDLLPQKSLWYFAGRFLNHPIYDYHVYAVTVRRQCHALVALRIAEAEGQRAIRIVDYWGDPEPLGLLDATWQDLMDRFDAEYIDLYCHGPLESALQGSAMRKLDPTGESVIPNHFEPLVRKNIVIRWAFKTRPGTRLQVCKADADQDRPNWV